MSDYSVHIDRSDEGREITTHAGPHPLEVVSHPDARMHQHTVMLGRPGQGAGPFGFFAYPSGTDPKRAYVRRGSRSGELEKPPSDELRSLIRHHAAAIEAGDHTAWMPLLDQLMTEYPDLSSTVEAHTAARNQS